MSRSGRSSDEDRTPSLQGLIDTKFSSLRKRRREDEQVVPNRPFDYGPTVQHLYNQARLCSAMENGCPREEEEPLLNNCPQIWCLSCSENIIAVGTSSGRVEMWEASTGIFKTAYDEGSGIGITCIKMSSGRVVLAKLNGTLQILRLDWLNRSGHTTYRRFGGHARTCSAGGADDLGAPVLRLSPGSSLRLHQQPVSVVEVEAGRVLSGSHDHTLKVVSLLDELLVFTLHGHFGPITALFIDSLNPLTGGSGSQDGGLCVWDLLTGACVYSLTAHDGRVTALTYSPSYVISTGADERLCIWDRFQGHLLNSIQLNQAYCTSLTMLTHNLLVTSQQGSLVVRDVRSGEPVRLVRLGNADPYTSIQTILRLRGSVACDYGDSIRIVKFPLLREKAE